MNILILFSTLSGTTEMVAKIIQKSLMASGHLITLHNVFDTQQVNLSEYSTLIFGAPTYDEELEISMKQYIAHTTLDLSKYKIAVFGLGDKMYPQYCSSVDVLENWIIKNSGTLAIQSLRIDGYPVDTEFINIWAKQINNFSVNE